jgi:hypothetical protein
VDVIRDRKEQNLNLSLPERKESGVLLEDEESLQGPLIDGEFAVDWSELKEKVADQMALASEKARTSARELRKDVCGQKKAFQQQAEKLKNQSVLEQKQLKKDQEKLRMQLNQLLQEQRKHWLDI